MLGYLQRKLLKSFQQSQNPQNQSEAQKSQNEVKEVIQIEAESVMGKETHYTEIYLKRWFKNVVMRKAVAYNPAMNIQMGWALLDATEEYLIPSIEILRTRIIQSGVHPDKLEHISKVLLSDELDLFNSALLQFSKDEQKSFDIVASKLV